MESLYRDYRRINESFKERGQRSGYSTLEAPRNRESQKHDCSPKKGAIEDCIINDDNIRIYLILQGIFSLLQLIVCILLACISVPDKEARISTVCFYCLNVAYVAFVIILLSWTITGSNWVWTSLGKWKDDHLLCNNALFISAIVCLLLHYVMILLMCCFCVCAICAAIKLLYS